MSSVAVLVAPQFEFELLFCLFCNNVSYSARNVAGVALRTTPKAIPGKLRDVLEMIKTVVLPVHCVHYERTHS